MPVPGEKCAANNFTGIFCAVPPPERSGGFLDAYIDAYWPQGNREAPEGAIWEWLCRRGLALRHGAAYALSGHDARSVQLQAHHLLEAMRQLDPKN